MTVKEGTGLATRFKKGQPSPNPGGRPRGSAAVAKAMRLLVPKAVRRLSQLLDSPDDRVVLETIKVVFDRSVGKTRDVIPDDLTPMLEASNVEVDLDERISAVMHSLALSGDKATLPRVAAVEVEGYGDDDDDEDGTPKTTTRVSFSRLADGEKPPKNDDEADE